MSPRQRSPAHYWVVFAVLACLAAVSHAQLTTGESNALISLYINSFSSGGGTSALTPLGWSTNTTATCLSPVWGGLTCTNGHITTMYGHGAFLAFYLVFLASQSFSIEGCAIKHVQFSITDALSLLLAATSSSLGGVAFNGPLPSDIDGLTYLQSLYVCLTVR